MNQQFECPKCRGTDLRVECTVVLTLDGTNGQLVLEDFDGLPQMAGDIPDEQAYTLCEGCETEGPIRSFIKVR